MTRCESLFIRFNISHPTTLPRQACEHIRTALDQLEPERDVENFVEEYGTGNAIPDPPIFIPYTDGPDASPSGGSSSSPPPRSAVSPPTTHLATFTRVSTRPAPTYPVTTASIPPPQDEQQPSYNQSQAEALAQVNGQHPPSPPGSINGVSGPGSIHSVHTQPSEGHMPPNRTARSGSISSQLRHQQQQQQQQNHQNQSHNQPPAMGRSGSGSGSGSVSGSHAGSPSLAAVAAASGAPVDRAPVYPADPYLPYAPGTGNGAGRVPSPPLPPPPPPPAVSPRRMADR